MFFFSIRPAFLIFVRFEEWSLSVGINMFITFLAFLVSIGPGIAAFPLLVTTFTLEVAI